MSKNDKYYQKTLRVSEDFLQVKFGNKPITEYYNITDKYDGSNINISVIKADNELHFITRTRSNEMAKYNQNGDLIEILHEVCYKEYKDCELILPYVIILAKTFELEFDSFEFVFEYLKQGRIKYSALTNIKNNIQRFIFIDVVRNTKSSEYLFNTFAEKLLEGNISKTGNVNHLVDRHLDNKDDVSIWELLQTNLNEKIEGIVLKPKGKDFGVNLKIIHPEYKSRK